MAIDISRKAWLAELVDRSLEGYEPASARLRLPPELRDPDPDGPNLEARARALVVRSLRRRSLTGSGPADPVVAFLGSIEGHIGLVLDLALLHGIPFIPERRKAELAAFFAGVTGEIGTALAVDPSAAGGSSPSGVRKAFSRAGQVLRRQGYPPGDPSLGIPIYAGALAIQRRHLARVALPYFRRGRLEQDALERELENARSELVLLVEALAGFAGADRPFDAERRRVLVQQISRLALPKAERRAARDAVLSPRPPREVARAAPAKIRLSLLEQLLVAQAARGTATPATLEVVQAHAEAAQVSPEQLTAMQVEAAALQADQQQWLEAFGADALPRSWMALGDDWEAAGDRMLERLATVVTENLEAIVTEIKQTGELGQLVAKATAGKTLTPEERHKVKDQLIDLAKAVPALAIFAAPGGMLLLPLLAKILPFNMLPSAWDKGAPAAPGAPERPKADGGHS